MHNSHFILFCIFSLSSVFNISLWLGRLCIHFLRLVFYYFVQSTRIMEHLFHILSFINCTCLHFFSPRDIFHFGRNFMSFSQSFLPLTDVPPFKFSSVNCILIFRLAQISLFLKIMKDRRVFIESQFDNIQPENEVLAPSLLN